MINLRLTQSIITNELITLIPSCGYQNKYLRMLAEGIIYTNIIPGIGMITIFWNAVRLTRFNRLFK